MHTHSLSSRCLDQIAISMAVICAIHCLITPILLVALPILATTVWVDANFHLWMILLVIPTTSLAVWSGCRRHRDRWVIAIATIGLGLLLVAITNERMSQGGAAACSSCNSCAPQSHQDVATISQTSAGLPWYLLLNVAGGLCLATAHTRNFFLCRKDSCEHGDQAHSNCDC